MTRHPSQEVDLALQLAGFRAAATAGMDILAPVEDLDNKNPLLVALGKKRFSHNGRF